MSDTPTESPTRIVVVDDSPTALRLMESALTQAGYDVTCLAEGAKALETIRRSRPRILFLDTSLGDVDIADLCRKVSEDEYLNTVALVLMTNRADPAAWSADVRVTDHITKPFTPEALLALVEHLVGRTDSGSESRPRSVGAASAPPLVARDPVRILATMIAPLLDNNEGKRAALTEQLVGILGSRRIQGQLWDVMRTLPGTPSLSGDSAAVPLPDILQALAFQRQTGILTAERGASRINIAYKDGAVRLVVGENVGTEFLLGAILVRERLIEPQELELVLQNRRGTTRRLGRQIVQLGYVSAEDLRRALWRQSSELVYELLRWRNGRFVFYHTVDLPAEYLEFELGVRMEALLMEGFRRVDEWGLIETVLPSFDLVPRRVAGGLAHLEGLTPEEQAVYDRVDGRRRASEIIDVVGGGAFEVARVLYRLISAHIVEMDSARGDAPPSARGPLIS